MELNIGQRFTTVEEADQYVQHYARAGYHPIRRRNMVTVQSYNKKVSEDARLPDGIKFQQMHWQCKHFGRHKALGTGKRQRTRTFANECTFQISVTYNRRLSCFTVTRADLEHANHEVSPDLYALYPDERQPSGSQASEVDHMLQVNGNATLVAQVLHKEGHAVRVKDLYNRKQKLSLKGTDMDRKIRAIMLQHSAMYSLETNDGNEFEGLFLQTPKQQQTYAAYGEVVQMDATYKTNNLRYALYTLLVEDGDGVGQPIAFAVLAREDQGHIERFLAWFKANNDMSATQCVVVDKDLAEINALKSQWSGCFVIICYFHVLRAIDRYLATSTMDADTKRMCTDLTRDLLHAKSEQEFDDCLVYLRDKVPDFCAYITTNWVPYKDNISTFGRSNIRHLSNRTNNRLESFHDTLKKVASSSRMSLVGLIEMLLGVMTVRTMETTHRKFAATMKVPVRAYNNTDINKYDHVCKPYAANIVRAEYEKLKKKQYKIEVAAQVTVANEENSSVYTVTDNSCSCSFPVVMGLPCRHLLAAWAFKKETLFNADCIAQRWLQSTALPAVPASVSTATPAITAVTYTSQCESRQQRFVGSMVLFKEMASYIADQPAADFNRYMQGVQAVRDCLFAGNLDVLLSTLEQQNQTAAAVRPAAEGAAALGAPVSTHTAPDSDEEPVDVEPDTPSAGITGPCTTLPSSPVGEVSGAPAEGRGEVGESSGTPVEGGGQGLESAVIFRPVPKARGRPAQARQRPFKVFGKKTTTKDANSTCVECGLVDPPKAVSRKQQVDWVMCDECSYWYHVCCTGKKAPRGKFVCVRCK